MIAGSVIAAVNVCVVHASPQSLDEDVVVGTAPTIRTAQPFGLFRSEGEGSGRKLRPPAGIG